MIEAASQRLDCRFEFPVMSQTEEQECFLQMRVLNLFQCLPPQCGNAPAPKARRPLLLLYLLQDGQAILREELDLRVARGLQLRVSSLLGLFLSRLALENHLLVLRVLFVMTTF